MAVPAIIPGIPVAIVQRLVDIHIRKRQVRIKLFSQYLIDLHFPDTKTVPTVGRGVLVPYDSLGRWDLLYASSRQRNTIQFDAGRVCGDVGHGDPVDEKPLIL